MPYQCVSTDEVKQLMDSGAVTLADIRDQASYLAGNIAQSIHVSDANLEQFLAESDKTVPLVIYCYHGNSSKGAADFFSDKGYTQVYSMDGGYEAWRLKYSG